MVGIAHRGIAFPISWMVLREGGSSSAEEQCKALGRFFAIVDPSDIEVVLADREFISAEWLGWLQAREGPFVARLRSDRPNGLSPNGPSLPARMFARPFRVGHEQVLGETRYLHGADGEHVEAKVVVRRVAPPEIETMFAALKSRGFKLEKTHLTEPSKIERLMGLLALAFARTHIVGERRAAREDRPRRRSHGRRQRSLFRYGLDLLRGILTTPEPQPAAFFDCLRGLRSPTAFLSCT